MRFGFSWLDVKLGLRMLLKYPGLAIAGSAGMAVAIGLGASLFEFFRTYLDPVLPLEQGDRIVSIQNADFETRRGRTPSLHDFEAWRTQATGVVEIAAFRPMSRNIVGADGSAEPVSIAEITATGLRVARVEAQLGRTLASEDELPGAPPVVVIGHDVWRTRYGASHDALGRELKLGHVVHTIVGVMPEGFAFPVNHRYWVPLRGRPSEFAPGKAPPVYVFGRLAPGVTREAAQAELTAIGSRTASEGTGEQEKLKPRVLPFTYPLLGVDDVSLWDVALMQLVATLVLLVPCANVAILVYARTATRQAELAVRNALGASRRRIVVQLFIEALVLALVSALLGIVLAKLALTEMHAIMQRETSGGTPFWLRVGISAGTVSYVALLAVAAAVIAGIVPALQATGRRAQAGVRALGRGTGLRLGKTWTALIVAQVAFTVALLPAAASLAWTAASHVASGPGFPAEQYLTARLARDRDVPPSAAAETHAREFEQRYGALQAELLRRLDSEPGVTAATIALDAPGQEPHGAIVVEGSAAAADASTRGARVRYLEVQPDFFPLFGIGTIAGRVFHDGDRAPGVAPVVVNRSFALEHFGGTDAVGRELRYVARDEVGGPADLAGAGASAQRHRIVGVVDDFPARPLVPDEVRARIYHPMTPGARQVAVLALKVQGGAALATAYTERLRAIAAELDPGLRLHDVAALDEVYAQEQLAVKIPAWILAIMTLTVLLLSAAGIYALMAFTVVQRRHEIGVRAALGAQPSRLLRSIFSRALGQLALGIGVGAGVAILVELASGGAAMAGRGVILLPAVALFMLAVGGLAALGPARTGLRIPPTVALREE